MERTVININDNEGTARYGGHDQQNIYPTATVTLDDIRIATERKSVRNAVVNRYKELLEQKGLNVTKKEDGGLIVSVPEVREKNITEFSNIQSLRKSNAERLRSYRNSRNQYESDEDYADDDPLRNPY